MKQIHILSIFLTIIVSVSCYSSLLAHDLSHLESITYQSQQNIDAWNCEQCKNHRVERPKSFFSSTANIQGFALYYPKNNAIIVAFRGSVDTKNWLYNLNTVVTGYPACSGCQVHLGFYSAYKGVAPLVRTAVEQLLSLYRGASLIITGHSLGGAMAVLCALDLKQIYGNVDLLYTFGQPRVGNQKFADFLQTQIPSTYRIINYADTVPHVPPSAFTFKHGGHQIWYNPRGMNNFKQCVSEDKTCANSISTFAMSTDDHSLSIYMTLQVIDSKNKNIRVNYKQNYKLKEEALKYSDEQISMIQLRKVQQIKQIIGNQLNLSI